MDREPMSELSCIAFSDVRELFDSSGRPLPLEQVSEAVRLALARFEVVTTPRGTAYRYEFQDKVAALDKLFQHHRLGS